MIALALPMEQILGDGLVNDIQSSLTNIDFIIQLYSFIRQERFALGCGTLRKFVRQIGARSHKRGNQGIGLISKLLVQRLWTIWQLNIYGVFLYLFIFLAKMYYSPASFQSRFKRIFLRLRSKCTKLKWL